MLMTDLNNGDSRQVFAALDRMKTDDGYFGAAPIIWDGLSSGQREQLNQLLHQGPIWDGNVLSKSARDDLISFGLATRCCFMGEDGYTVATYPAMTVFKAGKAKPFECKPGSVG
jgi:hypothetical protein